MPSTAWVWRQRWDSVLLLHYRVDREALAPWLPSALEIDEHDGSAWVSLVPFRMLNVRPRGMPALAPLSNFAELNLRTYVRHADKPGVFFLRILAAKRSAAWLARTLSPLPYVYAPLTLSLHGAGLSFRSDGLDVDASIGGAASATDEQDRFLTERYCLYASTARGIDRAEVHHGPWPLVHVRARVHNNALLAGLGVRNANVPDCVHYSRGVEVVAWPSRRVA
jgi:uncharacterized protein YqjF (DUF2071 family)